MNLQNVKSTMLERLLSQLAPHYCCSCGEIGSLLCESCKYDIVSEQYSGCVLCGLPVSSGGTCVQCKSVIGRTWCAGERSGGLEVLINRYKFDYTRAAHEPLGELVLSALPDLPTDTVIVPIPTIRAHIRQRGYDHALLLARYIADKRGLKLQQLLRRRTATVQRGSGRKQRFLQAKTAFGAKEPLQSGVPYLLVDDVVTTGATLIYAAKALQAAGASIVWAVAAARQPLDEQR